VKIAPARTVVDLISDVLPFGRLWYDKSDHAIGYAMHYSRSHDAVIRVYDAAGNVIETHEHNGDFRATTRFGNSLNNFGNCRRKLALGSTGPNDFLEPTYQKDPTNP